MLKVLNNYAGIGGNRKKWKDCEVTAVEINPQVAAAYKKLFPDDVVIVGDAHEYLLKHFTEFDFIWTSPRVRRNSRFNLVREARYVDMSLYQEIILLQEHFAGFFVAENVQPYYDVLIPAKKIDRHLFWSNFRIGSFDVAAPDHKSASMTDWTIADFKEWLGIDVGERISLRGDGTHYEQIYRNCVHPDVGEYVMNCARGIIKSSQPTLF